jgi:hypothetical protein
MTDRVDPVGNGVQATHRKPIVDSVFPQAQLEQLPPRNNPMLPLRHPSNTRIDPLFPRGFSASTSQPAYIAG